MGKDILTAIVEVEKEIEDLVAAEQSRAVERLAQLKRETEEEIKKEEEQLEASLQHALAAARADAEKKSAALVEAAAARTELLSRLDDRTLQEIIARHLNRIRPGRGNDRQNVKG